MLKNLVNKYNKKIKDEVKETKSNMLLNTFEDLGDIIEEKDTRYDNISKTKIFNKGGFDQIMKIKKYKSKNLNQKIRNNFNRKYTSSEINKKIINNNRNKLLIYPDSMTYLVLNIIVGIAILYSVTFIPYQMAFLIDNNVYWSIILEYIWDIIFIFDLLHNFFTAYIDNNLNLIDDRKKIITNYVFGWFFFDFISSIPFSLIDVGNENISNQNFSKIARFSKLPKILKIFRFAKLVKKFSYLKSEFKNTNIIINPALERLVITLFLVSIFLHLLACLWFISATWFYPLNNWVVILGYELDSNGTKYLTSLYWVVQTVFTVGYGDIPAFNFIERILAILSMFLGVFIYSFVVGSVSSLFFSVNAHLEKKNKSLEILGNLKKTWKLSNSIFKEIKHIIEKNL